MTERNGSPNSQQKEEETGTSPRPSGLYPVIYRYSLNPASSKFHHFLIAPPWDQVLDTGAHWAVVRPTPQP